MRLSVSLAGLLVASTPALAQVDLEPYLPAGVKPETLSKRLDDDLGSGLSGSVPSAVLYALLELDPERYGSTLREAYARSGFLFLQGRELPVGITEIRSLGVRGQQFNCLACHAGVGREAGEDGLLVVGATNPSVQFGGWFGRVFAGLRRLADQVRRRQGLETLPAPGIQRSLLVAQIGSRLVSAARKGMKRRGLCLTPSEVAVLLALARGSVDALAREGADEPRDPYGPGRTVVQQAYRKLRFDLEVGPFAPVKPPDLFGVRVRKTLLWTGNETYDPGTPAAERIARNGMLVPWIQLNPVTEKPIPDALTLLRAHRYLDMGELLAQAAPPAAPAPETPDEQARFRRGQAVFRRTCLKCHGDYRFDPEPTPTGAAGLRAVPVDYPERVVSLRTVGTDPAYATSNDAVFLEAFEDSLLGRARLFNGRVTNGYVARPLLGLRLRAPFLHNGSVPNLRALLTPPGERPDAFWVGQGVPYDPQAVGLKHPLAKVPSRAVLREARSSGDSPQGHRFGTRLSDADKRDLLAFLRRL